MNKSIRRICVKYKRVKRDMALIFLLYFVYMATKILKDAKPEDLLDAVGRLKKNDE